MKQFVYIIFFVILIDVSFQNCANPGRPTGGPKDTIPPTLTYSSPANGTLNFDATSLELHFSEDINADKLKQQLIVTPTTNLNFKSIVKRNKLIIKLLTELNDSTTYNFNFANGITDITEKNPAINLSLAFSTGPSIDSMSVEGYVEDLLSKEPAKEYVVGLYPVSDTLNYFTDKPIYFTTTNDSGNYQIKYIKTGNYKIMSFKDDNGNYLLDPDTESHGFLSDTMVLDSATTLRPLRCLLQNVKPLSLINARPVGNYVEVKFNKQIDGYSISPQYHSHIVGENKDIIRLYKPNHVNFNDSLTSILTASDSLGNEVNDTIKYVFLESYRKPSSFSYTHEPTTIEINKYSKLNLTFNKPIESFDSSKIVISADSLLTFIPKLAYNWNENATNSEIIIDLNKQLIDSLISSIAFEDSTATDSSLIAIDKPKTTLSIKLKSGAFISVESDTSSEKSLAIREAQYKPTGVLKVKLTTDKTSFRFQLLNNSNEVVYQKLNSKDLSFPAVKPGEYRIRILIDSNDDGSWSYGNLLKNHEPEEVFIYSDKTSIRENWVVELNISF